MDFDKICTMFTMQEPFYGILLSSMERVPVSSQRCQTLGVTKSGNVFRLIYNKDFVEKLDIPTTIEVIKHEVLHVAFSHFSLFDTPPIDANEQKMRNISADLEVNGYINKNNVHNIPLQYAAIYGWEEMAGTKEYFRRFLEQAQQENKQQNKASENAKKPCNGGKSSDNQNDKNEQEQKNETEENTQDGNGNNEREAQGEPGDGDIGGENNSGEQKQDGEQICNGSDFSNSFVSKFNEFDDHSQWPEDKESIEACSQMIEDMIISAAAEVEKSCGRVPSEMRGRIDDIVNKRKPKPVADWKRYVRRYLGNEFSEFIRKSKKRESKRFPDAAGNKHRRKSHILVGVDTSGSVSMPEYIEFFGQIRTLTSTATFEVVECDAAIQKIYTFRNRPNLEIHGGGGTSFEPVVDMFVSNKKKYDALIYFTDGECHVPQNTPKETLWVISSRGDKNRRKEFQVNGASVVYIPKKN